MKLITQFTHVMHIEYINQIILLPKKKNYKYIIFNYIDWYTLGLEISKSLF